MRPFERHCAFCSTRKIACRLAALADDMKISARSAAQQANARSSAQARPRHQCTHCEHLLSHRIGPANCSRAPRCGKLHNPFAVAATSDCRAAMAPASRSRAAHLRKEHRFSGTNATPCETIFAGDAPTSSVPDN